MLLSEAFEAYRQDVIIFTNQSPRTEEQHNLALKSFLKHVGDTDTSDLTFTHIRDWTTSLTHSGCSANTVRYYLIKFRNVLGYLEKKNIACLKKDEIPLAKRIENVPQFITPEEVQRLIDAAPYTRGKAIISLLYASGIRVSELCKLDRNDLHDGRFTIVGKGNKPRLCFYDERTARLLYAYLKKRRDNHPALFVQHKAKSRLNRGNVEEVFKCAREKAGFTKRVTPHTMRHSFATNLASEGMPIHSIQRLMGHSNLQTTSIYLHVSNPRLEEEYQKYHTLYTTPTEYISESIYK